MSMLVRALAPCLLLGCATASPTTVTPAHAPARAPLTEAQRVEDFDTLWAFVQAHYPYFSDKATDWQAVRATYRARAARAPDDLAFLHVLEGALDELYDPHCMLNTNASDSWRPLPHDIWAEWHGDAAIVTAVRVGSDAAAAGVRPGQRITRVGDLDVAEATAQRLPKTPRREDPAARAWALLSAVAGRHGDPRRLTVIEPDGRTLILTLAAVRTDDRALVSARTLDDGVGYIAITSFGDDAAVAAFDEALASLRDAPALIIDVRDNPGGDTAVARPIMGRFIHERRPYARMARRAGDHLGAPWTEHVDPRGPWTYDGPVIVLVNRFSVSMAEGFAMGMQGIGRATLVGTAMAGLGAAIGRVELHHFGIAAQISTEPVFHVDGTPRWQLHPDLEVDVVAAGAAGADPILAAALARLGAAATQ